MRNGVVDVQKVKRIKLGNLRHSRGQCQIIRRVIKQGITRNINFVIVNIGIEFCKPDGLGIRDEVNFVAPVRQFQTEFGSHHTAATVSRITGDPNFHGGFYDAANGVFSDSMAGSALGFRFVRICESMRLGLKFAVLAFLAASTSAQLVTSAPGCPAPVYFGICNPYVPGVFVAADPKGGISVLSTWHDGPAEKAGICPSDKIVAVNATVAAEKWDRLLRELVSDSPTPVVLRVRRGQEEFRLQVPRVRETTLAALSGEKFVSSISGSMSMPPGYGLRVVPKGMTSDSLRALIDFRARIPTESGPDASIPGRLKQASDYFTGIAAMYDEANHEAMVAEVSYPSPAFSASVYPGDLITKIGNRSLTEVSREQLAETLAPASSKALSLELMRSAKRLTIRLVPIRYGDALQGIGRKLTSFGPAPLHCPD